MAEGADYEVAIGTARFDPLDEQADVPARLDAPADEREPEPSGWLVQFHAPLGGDDIARLRRQYGLALTRYVPELAYLERLAVATVARLRQEPSVRAIAPYRPEYKLAATLVRPIEDLAEADEVDVEEGLRIRVLLFDDAEPARVRVDLEDAGATDVRIYDDRELGGDVTVAATLTDRTVADRIAQMEDVRWIEPVTPLVDDNVAAASTIQAGSASSAPIWDKGLHGEGQIIGVMDSAPLDINHCFFIDSTNNTPRAAHRKVVSIRNASGTAAGGHATFVAGCAAGDDVNNSGSAARRGGAWAAKLASANRRDLTTNTLLVELTAARDAGAFIHTNSWHDNTAGAGNPATYNQNAARVDTFTWNNEDHLVLGSAGNNGEEQGPPGTAKNAICVAAAQADPNEMDLGDGNAGPTADGRRKPDLVTVGCSIRSATVNTTCGTGTRSACATSYATPHAAAAAALVRQYFTEGWYPTGTKQSAHALTPTGALMKAVLIASTLDMTGVAGFPSDSEGWGLVQLRRALFFEGDTRKLRVFDVRNADGLSTGQDRTYRITVEADTEPLRVVLVWTEPPGTAAAANPVVNDLDLEVTDPSGSTFRGNVFSGGQSTTGGTADTVNNVEVVQINSPAVGNWTVRVKATRVSVGNPDQGYAVAVAGDISTPSCFVATAVYGDIQHADVEMLRAWRDSQLESGARGRQAMRALVTLYVRVGPRLAAVVRDRPTLARILRERIFAPVAARLERTGRGSRS